MVVFDFIEGFYNPYRRHSGLGHLSPVNYERKSRVQAAYISGTGYELAQLLVRLGIRASLVESERSATASTAGPVRVRVPADTLNPPIYYRPMHC